MATTQEDVNKLIETMVQEKTLSLDAIISIQALKDRVAKADVEIEQHKGVVKARDASIVSLQVDNGQLKAQIKPIADRERAVAEREAKVTALERDAAVAQAESRAFRHALGVVFAPNTVRESIQKFGSISQPNGQYSPTSESGTVAHKQGYDNPDNARPGTGQGDRSHLG